MNKKLVRDFLILTFSLGLLGWGLCAALCHALKLTLNDHITLKILFFLGGMSPTIASFVALRRSGQIHSLGQWLKHIFDPHNCIWGFLLAIVLVAICYFLGCLISGYTPGAPIPMLLILTPMMLLGGGNEEAGWRMLLQPELEKKYGFPIATILVGVIWWLWHGPLFLIPGTANASMNYLYFGIMCLCLSFALGAVRKCSNRVLPCVLLHCLFNACSAVFVFQYSLGSCAVTAAVVIPLSLLIVYSSKKPIRLF